MIYHFVKNIGIDVQADSLEQATDFVNDIDNYDDMILNDTWTFIKHDNDFADDIGGFDIHAGHSEYAGYTDDCEDDADDGDDPEERLYDYLADGTDCEDDDAVDALASAFLKALLATVG